MCSLFHVCTNFSFHIDPFRGEVRDNFRFVLFFFALVKVFSTPMKFISGFIFVTCWPGFFATERSEDAMC